MYDDKYKILNDAKAGLKFKTLTKISLPVPVYEMGWEDLHETRSNAKKGLTAMLDFCDKDKRNLNTDEEDAFEFGSKLLDCINDEFREREKYHTKEPIDRRKSINAHLNPWKTVNSDSRINVNPRSYRGMFGDDLNNGGFKNLREFFSVALSGRYDPRLAESESRAQKIGIGTDGGYSVPTELAALLMDNSLEAEIIRPRATIFPMAANSLEIPAWDADDHRDGNLYGGFTLNWLSEGGTATVQTAKMRMMTLTAHKAGLYANMSNEILSDEPRFQNWLSTAMQKAISTAMDKTFIDGNSIGKPQGLINCPSTITVSRATSGQISLSDLISVYARLHSAFMADAIWIISASAKTQLMSVTDQANHLVWSPDQQSIREKVPNTLFGHPVFISEKSPALGSKGDVILVSPSQYGIGLRGDIRVEMTNAANWNQDLTDIRVLLRLDGQGLWDKPITPMNGGDTLSWCVCLQ